MSLNRDQYSKAFVLQMQRFLQSLFQLFPDDQHLNQVLSHLDVMDELMPPMQKMAYRNFIELFWSFVSVPYGPIIEQKDEAALSKVVLVEHPNQVQDIFFYFRTRFFDCDQTNRATIWNYVASLHQLATLYQQA